MFSWLFTWWKYLVRTCPPEPLIVEFYPEP